MAPRVSRLEGFHCTRTHIRTSLYLHVWRCMNECKTVHTRVQLWNIARISPPMECKVGNSKGEMNTLHFATPHEHEAFTTAITRTSMHTHVRRSSISGRQQIRNNTINRNIVTSLLFIITSIQTNVVCPVSHKIVQSENHVKIHVNYM